MRKRNEAVSSLILVLSIILFAGPAHPQEARPEGSARLPDRQGLASDSQSRPPEKQIIESLEFREVDIKDVLRQLSKQYNLNIVFSEKVSGLITVQLSRLTLEEALDSIITVNGFIYTRKDNVLKVTTSEEAQAEGKQTKLFRLNNAEALKLKDALLKVLSPDGSIEADLRSNSLIITDTLSIINKIEEILPELDNLTPQVLIETKLIETSLTRTDKLGIDWTTTLSASGAKRPTTLPFSAKGDKDTLEAISPINSSTGFPTGYPYAFPNAATTDFTFGTLDASKLQSIFDFLKSRSNTELIANPRVVTLNNQKAIINVGKVLSLPTYERNTTTGAMEITGWEKMPLGVLLEVTPQISPDGHIKLKLRPEVSSLIGYASTRNGVNEGPTTSTRTVETEVLIKDGQSVVIGGLVKNESMTKVNKVPILGDIPLIGFIFTRKEVGSDSSPSEKTDLLIFVTARIIKDTNERLIARDSNLITAAPRPFKLEMREVK